MTMAKCMYKNNYRKMLMIVLLLLAWLATADVVVRRVVDGDTLEIHTPFMPKPLPDKLLLRVRGVDTPERAWRARCGCEATKAEEAYEFVDLALFPDGAHVGAASHTVHLFDWDKYGGRVLGDVVIHDPEGDILISDALLDMGLAVPYRGSGARYDWCKKKN